MDELLGENDMESTQHQYMSTSLNEPWPQGSSKHDVR